MLVKDGAQSLERRNDDAIKRWRAHRLGQFVHFGLYSIPAGRWEGKYYGYASEFLPQSASISPASWAGLVDSFELPAFDADQWALAAKEAGAGYITITTKHHEGFCLWPSKYTDFHIGNSPFKRDLLEELVKAYNKYGIDVILYYSILDWHHPDWRYKEETVEDNEAGGRYREYAMNQLKELAVSYPTVKGFWFDGTWDDSIRLNGWWTLEIENTLKDLIPGCLVNSRLRADAFGNRHFDAEGRMMGDFQSGFERRLPDTWDLKMTEMDWEACMTIPQHTWGYHSGEWASKSVKDWRDIIDQLAHTISMGGNFLLNVGPRGDGSHNPDDLKVTEAVGDWVERHSDAIRNTEPEPRIKTPNWGFFTRTCGSSSTTQQRRTYGIVTRISTSKRVLISVEGQYSIDDLQISRDGPDADVVRYGANALELRLKSTPIEPFVVSFVLHTRTDGTGGSDINPDVID